MGAPRKSRKQKHIRRDRIERAKAVAMAAQVVPPPEQPKTGWTRDNKIGVVTLLVTSILGVITLLLTTPEGRSLIHRPSDATPENHSEPVRPTVVSPPAEPDRASEEVRPRPQTSKRMKQSAKKGKS